MNGKLKITFIDHWATVKNNCNSDDGQPKCTPIYDDLP